MKRPLRLALFALLSTLALELAAHGDETPSGPLQLDESTVGSVAFENSCSTEVQSTFNRAMALLHSFWFAAAIETFDDVLSADPKCAMAEWGKAMSHWGNPLGNNRDKALLRPGADAVARARKLPTGSSREREYIDAVGALYEDFENSEDHPRAVAYEQAMEQLAANYPNDSEAAVFYALALNGTADLTDKTYAQPLRAAKILESVFAEQPNHPGVAHYIIHSYDVPSLAQRALPAARQYAGIAPAAPHALHMPSHTFTRLGHWQESIDTNLRSATAALGANSPAEALHAIDYMVYAYLQTGQDAAARSELTRTAEVFAQVQTDDRYLVAGAYAALAVPTRFALERGDWTAATQVPAIKSKAPFVEAITHLAHGVGGARSGDIELARISAATLMEIETKLAKNAYWAGRVKIQRTVVEAWLAFAQGEFDAAVEQMRAAVKLEGFSEKSAISPGPLAPASEQLGDLLLELERPAEALLAYKQAIARDAGRFRGLFGAAFAADLAGDTGTAKEYFARLVEICEKADEPRPELEKARAYLQQAAN